MIWPNHRPGVDAGWRVLVAMLLCLSIIVLTGCSTVVVDDLRGDVSRAQASGTWLGYGFSGDHLYRLYLEENGSGTFSLLYDGGDAPTVSNISWDIQHHAVLIEFKPSGNQPPVAVARATNRGEYTLLEVKDGSWTDTAWLQRKERVEKQIQVIEGAAGASSEYSH